MPRLLGDKTPGRPLTYGKVPTGNTGPTKVHILASPPHATATRIPSNLLNNNEKENLRQAAGESEGKNKGLEGGAHKGHKT